MDNEGGLSDAPQNGILGSIDLRPRDHVVDLTGQIHQLPCYIKHNGPCPVSHYFKPKNSGIEVDDFTVEEAYFRGRKLQGTTIPLPDGYSGFVLGKKKKPCKGKASEISEGNLNCWEIVANALHKPITDDDLASTSLLPK